MGERRTLGDEIGRIRNTSQYWPVLSRFGVMPCARTNIVERRKASMILRRRATQRPRSTPHRSVHGIDLGFGHFEDFFSGWQTELHPSRPDGRRDLSRTLDGLVRR